MHRRFNRRKANVERIYVTFVETWIKNKMVIKIDDIYAIRLLIITRYLSCIGYVNGRT